MNGRQDSCLYHLLTPALVALAAVDAHPIGNLVRPERGGKRQVHVIAAPLREQAPAETPFEDLANFTLPSVVRLNGDRQSDDRHQG